MLVATGRVPRECRVQHFGRWREISAPRGSYTSCRRPDTSRRLRKICLLSGRARHPHVHFPFTPTRANRLNQIECWFSILGRQALQGASFTSARERRPLIASSRATISGPCRLSGKRKKCTLSTPNDITLNYVTKYSALSAGVCEAASTRVSLATFWRKIQRSEPLVSHSHL